MSPVDNLLSVIEEPLQTMRFRGLPHTYQPGQLELALDVLFQGGGMVRSRNGFIRFATGMPDISAAGVSYAAGTIGYARANASRQVAALLKRTPTVMEFWLAAAAGGGLLRTFTPTNHGGTSCIIGDFANVGGLGLYACSSSYDNNGTSPLLFWYGGAKTIAATGGTVTVTRGQTHVTLAGPTNWLQDHVGSWLTDQTGTVLIGRIASLAQTGLSAELERPATASLAGVSYRLLATRNFLPRIAKGRLTVGIGTTTVIGAGTKFISGRGSAPGFTCAVPGGVTTSGWYLFRQSDMAFVGYVQSFDSDLQLTLQAGAVVGMQNDRYLLVPQGASSTGAGTPSMVWDSDVGAQVNVAFGVRGAGGFICEEHQGRLYLANRPDSIGRAAIGATVWISDDSDYEAFDLSEADGDWLVVGRVSQPITGMVSMQQGLAILKANELWMLYGDDPINYQLRKIADVGTADGRSIQTYQGAILFVSQLGVMRFDGTTITNLTEAMIDPASFAATANFSVNTFPIIGMQVGSIYLWTMIGLFSSSIDAQVDGEAFPRADNSNLTGVLDLTTGALSLFSNVLPLAACQLPQDGQQRSDCVWVGRDGSANARCNIFGSANMLAPIGAALGSHLGSLIWMKDLDYWGCSLPFSGQLYTAGPHPYLRTRRLGLPQQRIAYWKEVWADYICPRDAINVESYWGDMASPSHLKEVGLFDVGGNANMEADTFLTAAARVRLMHRGQFLSLVLYPRTDPMVLGANPQTAFAVAGLSVFFMPMRRSRAPGFD